MASDPLRQALDTLMPMNMQLDDAGCIAHVGPTLAKCRNAGYFIGLSVFDVFDFKRPKDATTMEQLRAHIGEPLRLGFRDAPKTALRGTIAEVAQVQGVVINLSFGLSILDAIKQYSLTSGDFPTTDPTLEMLYLIEAKSAAMDESRDLNLRLQGAKIAAEEQAFTDTLTGLKNRRALDHVLSRYRDQRVGFTLLGIDLDFFKSINDTLGHAAGDHVLQKVARIMVDHCDPSDTIARIGGDEFLIILRDRFDPYAEMEQAQALISKIEEPIAFKSDTCLISASIGIFSSSEPELWTIEQMLGGMDAALYFSKRQGRAQATVYEPGMEVGEKPVEPRGSRMMARAQAMEKGA